MKKKNAEVQSRRDFFKKAAKAALPILGIAVLGNISVIANAATSSTAAYCSGCKNDCTNGCAGGCHRSCATSCSLGCQGKSSHYYKGDCDGCRYNCGGCSGYCSGTCSGSCSGSSYKVL